jgi:hypothetical protein
VRSAHCERCDELVDVEELDLGWCPSCVVERRKRHVLNYRLTPAGLIASVGFRERLKASRARAYVPPTKAST